MDCVDEHEHSTTATDTCPMSSLRFVPPFASTLPPRNRATTDPIETHMGQGQGQGPFTSLGGRERAATEPPSLQQQQQKQQQQQQYYNHHQQHNQQPTTTNMRMGASVDLADEPSQGGSYIYEYAQGGPSLMNNNPHPTIIYPHDEHKLALVLSTSSVDWNCPHIVTFVLEYLLGDNLSQLQLQGGHLTNAPNGKASKGSKTRGGGRGKRPVNPLSIQEVTTHPCL